VVAGCLLAGALVPSAAAGSPEGSMIDELNRTRHRHGLPSLRSSSSLHESSSRYARYLMRRDVFAHRAQIAVASRFQRAGENLELHSGWDLKPRWTVRRWMTSAGHRALILSRDFRWIGVGRARGRFNSSAATIWVAHFGRV
jgi:uncharacterized protein YkwD